MMKKILLLTLLFLSFTSISYSATNWIAESDCVAAWLMEVDEDPLTDSSVNSNTAALKGAGEPNYLTADPPDSGDGFDGTSVGYYDFDGTDDYAVATDHATLDIVNMTTVAWMFTDDGGAYDEYISKWAAYLLRRPSYRDSSSYIWYNTGSVGQAYTTDNSFMEGSWNHSAGTYDGETVTVYLNGVSKDTDTTPSGNMDTNTNDLRLGLRDGGGANQALNGKMDEVGIFNIAHDSTDINDMMDNGLYQVVAGNPVSAYTIFQGDMVIQGSMVLQ